MRAECRVAPSRKIGGSRRGAACGSPEAACLLKLEKWREAEAGMRTGFGIRKGWKLQAVCNAILRVSPDNEKDCYCNHSGRHRDFAST